uniref:Protein kinase domain-containing protein n=1 Tax=Oryza meridionalis TaxID=40149 RepID=A0A0E0D5D0_9ORYZ
MERRDNFLQPPAAAAAPAAGGGKGLPVPATGDATNLTSSSSSTSSLTLSPPDFLRQVQAALKRHRPTGSMQSNQPRATRVLVSRGEGSTKAVANPSVAQNPEGKVMQQRRGPLGASRLRNAAPDQNKAVVSSQDELLLTTPLTLGTITDTHDQNGGQNHQPKSDTDLLVDRKKSSMEVSSSQMASANAFVGEDFKKDLFYLTSDPQLTSQTGDNCPVAQVADDQGKNHKEIGIASAAVEMDIKYDAANLSRRIDEACDQNHGEPMTRCSAMGSSVTAVSLYSGPTIQSKSAAQIDQYASPAQMPQCGRESSGVSGHGSQELHGVAMNHADCNTNKQQVDTNGGMDKPVSSSAVCLPSQGLSGNDQSLSAKDDGAPRRSKVEKERRKKNYDPDVFFKVNGKLYQKLGKIGSGGSSEVHKVISAECTIYALKKIKLKGRDYPTAYGFCQEIEYLNKLKGKSNIIQLIDYEVTDKSLLQDDSLSPRDGRIKDDHYIYMVLEYGEIDLANMVAQEWKERNTSNMKIDENWLRFYWQQMLKAVNTIHEERIVHSDLKPANFLLVRGALKLIDFGIAKAIMNDTTNIQRDSQIGTLNYMSPEAFMCNEQDSGGNVIKCGRPSDIWSLGCILYQMVYGKTPFADYKNFWAKFKVVTDKNHKIKYEPVDNPWLIDLMQRCLAWDRNDRWRIPQLLEHPFLVPLVPRDLPSIDQDPCRLLMERVRVHWTNPKLHSFIAELEKDQCRPATQM